METKSAMAERPRCDSIELGSSSALTSSPTNFHDSEWRSFMAYWNQHLQHLSALELPTDRVRRTGASGRVESGKHEFEVPGELVSALQQVGVTAAVDLQTVLLAATQSLLSRYCRQEEFAVAVQTAASKPMVERTLMGLPQGTLLLRADISGDLTVGQLLTRVQHLFLEALNYSDVTCDAIADEPGETGMAQPAALARVLFAFANESAVSRKSSRREDLTPGASFECAGFDLELHLLHVGESLNGMIVYRTDLFDSATIERMVGHFQRLLEGIAGDVSGRVSALPLLTEREREEILQEWNATESEYPSASSVHGLFERQVERSPDSVAVTFEDQRLSYRELNERSNQLAHRLLREGVEPETLVGLCLERSPDLIVGILGILKAGGAYVPLDINYPSQRLQYMLRDAGISQIVTQGALSAQLPEHPCRMTHVDQVRSSAKAEDSVNPQCCVTADSLVYVMYTSGSTGNPKGVAMRHRGIVNLADWQGCEDRLRAPARVLQFASCSFDVSMQEIATTLGTGGTLILVSETARRDMRLLWKAIITHRVERLFVPFVVLQQLAEHRPTTITHLRDIVSAGESLLLTDEIRGLVSSCRDCRLHNQYGPTESHVVTAVCLDRDSGTWPAVADIGKPICNTQVYVLDGHDQLQPVGVAGGLCVAGPGLAHGYLNRPELTASKFVRNPYSAVAGGLMYRTGDLCRWRHDGCLEFLGRMDDQVKLRGFRIELGEIESALQLHPSVSQSVVIVREDRAGEQRLVAYVVWRSGLQGLVSELRDHLRVRLPEYMVPTRIVEMSEFPLTSSGKLDRRRLPLPADVSAEFSDRYEAARTETEEQMVRIWCEVLGIDRVGIHDNFFGLGGHSLLATRVIARVSAALGVELPLRRIFESPTIAELARALSDVQRTVEPVLGSRVLSSVVRASDSGCYVVSVGSNTLPFLRSIGAGVGIIYLGRGDLSGSAIPEVAIEDLADQFAAELVSLGVSGPLVVVGFSFHGAVTLALVERLRLLLKQRIVAVVLEPSLPEIPQPRLTQLVVRGRQLISWTRSRAGKLYRRGPVGLMNSLRARLSKSGAVVRGSQDEQEYVSQATPGLIRSIQKFRPGKTAFGDIYLVGGQPYLDQYLERFQTLIFRDPQILNLGEVAHMDVYNERHAM